MKNLASIFDFLSLPKIVKGSFLTVLLLVAGLVGTPRVAHAGGWYLDHYVWSADIHNEDLLSWYLFGEGYSDEGLHEVWREGRHPQGKILPVSQEALEAARLAAITGDGPADYLDLDWRGTVQWNSGNPLSQTDWANASDTPEEGKAICNLNIRPVFKWRRDYPQDEAPDRLIIVEYATVLGSEGIRQWDGGEVTGVNAQNPFKNRHFEFENVTNGLDGGWKFVGHYDSYNHQQSFYSCDGMQVTQIKTNKQDVVEGPTRRLGGTIKLKTSYLNETFDTHGWAHLTPFYSAQVGGFTIGTDLEGDNWTSPISWNSTKTAHGLAKRHVTDTTTEQEAQLPAVMMLGRAEYKAIMSPDLAAIFTQPEYEWDATPYPEVFHLPNFTDENLAYKSGASKTFYHKLTEKEVPRVQVENWSKTSNVSVKVTSPALTLPLTKPEVTVHWSLDLGSLCDVEVSVQPIPADGESLEDAEYYAENGDEIWKDAEEKQRIDREFIQTGASYVGTALEIQSDLAGWFVPDTTDLALAAIPGGLGKAAHIAQKVKAKVAPRVEVALALWKAKRLAKGKSDNVGFLVTIKSRFRGKAGKGATDVPTGKVEEAEVKFTCGNIGCFVAGTPVWLADGTTRPIEQIKVGDLVLSKNEATGEVAAKRVLKTFTRDGVAVLNLHIGGEIIGTTTEHPFYVAGRGFVKAGELGIGNAIVTRAGPNLPLQQANALGHTARVYNFEVEDFHSYFVGKSAAWVHNTGLCRVYGNHYPEMLPEELAHAAAQGVTPLSLGAQNWQQALQAIIDQGGKIKWIVTEDGILKLCPRYVNGQISHAVLHNGQPVIAAGEARIVVENGRYVLSFINNHSGHYKPELGSEEIAKQIFAQFGIALR